MDMEWAQGSLRIFAQKAKENQYKNKIHLLHCGMMNLHSNFLREVEMILAPQVNCDCWCCFVSTQGPFFFEVAQIFVTQPQRDQTSSQSAVLKKKKSCENSVSSPNTCYISYTALQSWVLNQYPCNSLVVIIWQPTQKVATVPVVHVTISQKWNTYRWKIICTQPGAFCKEAQE